MTLNNVTINSTDTKTENIAQNISLVHFKDLCTNINFTKRNVIVSFRFMSVEVANYMLNNMTKDSILIVIEQNRHEAELLASSVHDHRLKIHHDSPECIDFIIQRYNEKVDYVISSLVFSNISPLIAENIVMKTREALKETGVFLPYESFEHVQGQELKQLLEKHFSLTDESYLMKSTPPLRLYKAMK
ncbi:hypothetical protein [Evansella cellulosilytica]|uniref:Uncharacterized protein n=1 Tax=Evansella cellulosilytica (strain ATCC 21833 / DSM 2522 / FERM P-1141 / JCM 9156 / N-4) TaxID=649639 RepID=E6TZZ5_EVAC2|nr:hypothetical protein [Evansella cellulosilytica]ADU28999.1 hypothetical protein Bcell_0717 [Evansella cellulosilytica DSM 2522]